MIGIITYISILERIKEIGIYKGCGMSNKNIRDLFLNENIFMGIISSSVSYIIYILLMIPINDIFYNLTGLNLLIKFNINIFFIILLTAIVINIVGSLVPIFKINKLEIVDCLKYET